MDNQTTLAYEFVNAAFTLLGMMGVALPPLFTNLGTEQWIAGIAVTLIGIVWSLFSHGQKVATINNLKGELLARKGSK